MRRVPRHPLNADFVRAVRGSGHGLVALAALADFAAYTQLSTLLNTKARVSPLNIARLRTLAQVIGYCGPIYNEATR